MNAAVPPALPYLTSLTLDWHQTPTPDLLSYLAAWSGRLQRLAWANCDQLGDPGLAGLVAALPRLTEVRLHGTHVYRSVVIYVHACGKWCNNQLGDPGLAGLVAALPRLTEVRAHGGSRGGNSYVATSWGMLVLVGGTAADRRR